MSGFGERARAAKPRQMTTSAILFQGYDHVGIRVSDAGRALDFYARLGFRIDPDFSSDDVAEIVASDGTRINLIFNGAVEPTTSCSTSRSNGRAIRMAPSGGSLQSVLDWAAREGVAITEGPVDWGRRLTCFVRDPDGNVLEFNELRRE